MNDRVFDMKFSPSPSVKAKFKSSQNLDLSAGSKIVTVIESDDHNTLLNRDLPDQHPIGAITGLQDILDNVPSTSDFAQVAFTGDAEDLVWPEPFVLYCGTASEVIS